MPNNLRSAISDLAASFATSVVAAIRGASLEEILAASDGGAGGQPPRRPVGRPRRSTKKATKSARTPPDPEKSKGGRLPRRSPADIAKALAQVVELVKKNPKGLRAEQIRANLKMAPKEMPRVLKEGLAKKTLKSKGQKRSTTYTAV